MLGVSLNIADLVLRCWVCNAQILCKKVDVYAYYSIKVGSVHSTSPPSLILSHWTRFETIPFLLLLWDGSSLVRLIRFAINANPYGCLIKRRVSFVRYASVLGTRAPVAQ